MKIITYTPGETASLGASLGQLSEPGDVIFLSGELGAGKTVLAQGIAAGLGVRGPVTSPSFVLVNEYQGRLPFFHLDLYRLQEGDLPALGLEDYFDRPGVVVVEWPEILDRRLVPAYLEIQIRPLDEQRRELTFCPAGERPEKIVRRLAGGNTF